MTTNSSQYSSFGPDRQRQIFMEALIEDASPIPLTFTKLEAKAKEAMDEGAYGYVAGSAGREETSKQNCDAFSHWKLQPRVLTDIEERSLKTELFGLTLPAPVMLAPVGVQSIIHPEGARASALAAEKLGLPFVHSTVSSYSIEEIADTSDQNSLIFQLYWSSMSELNQNFIRRAEKAGYDALMVTLDTPLMGWRPRDLDNGYFPFLEGYGLKNYTSDEVFRDNLDTPPEESMDETIELFLDIFSNPSATWKDLQSLAESTDMPIIVKGILHPEDAAKCVESGIDGIVVSNHGGRQIDGEIAALDALQEIAKDYGKDLTILYDSGIRTGSDAFKALAIGSKAVMIGRPYLYGLAINGSAGIETVMQNILAELDLTMGLCGVDSIETVDDSILVPER